MLGKNSSLGLALLLPVSFLAACGQGASGDSAGSTLNPLQVAAFRKVCEDRGLEPLAAPPAVRDELFELGEALFFDPLLSGNLDVSCSTCHLPDQAGGDGRTLPAGVGGLGQGPLRAGGALIPRNSPSVLAGHLLPSMFWDSKVRLEPDGLATPAGAAFTPELEAALEPGLELLGAQAMFPVTSRGEMRGNPGESELGDVANGDVHGIWNGLMDRILAIPAYVDLFRAAYPNTPLAELNFGHAGNAIGAYEAVAFAKTDTPLDRFLRGDDEALSADQLAGGLEFFGAAACDRCHNGSFFTDGEHHNIGLPQFGPGKGHGTLQSDDFGQEGISGDPADRYRFRTPTLVNIELTAPYGHLGQYATLRDMINHYVDPEARLLTYDITTNVDDPALVPTQYDNTTDVLDHLAPMLHGRRDFDVDAVVAFMGALTDESARDMSHLTPDSVPSGLPLR